MDKTLAGLLGMVGTLAATLPAQAAPTLTPTLTAVMHADTYADLLKPIPNASTLLQASDAALDETQPEVVLAQYRDHHHHRVYRHRRPVRRHHHHHHSMMVVPNAPHPA